jgi:hypothetical protein
MNAFQNVFGSQQNVVVPKPEHSVASRFQPSGAPLIVLDSLGMLASINFDHEVRLEAGEVQTVTAHWDLAAEVKAIDLLAAQPTPKASLSIGHRCSKLSGSLNIGARGARHWSHFNAPWRPPP